MRTIPNRLSAALMIGVVIFGLFVSLSSALAMIFLRGPIDGQYVYHRRADFAVVGSIHDRGWSVDVDPHWSRWLPEKFGVTDTKGILVFIQGYSPGAEPVKIIDLPGISVVRNSSELSASLSNWITLPAGLVPLLVWLWFRFRLRMIDGVCATCGYDLRATPHRCPECGDGIETFAGRFRQNLNPADFSIERIIR